VDVRAIRNATPAREERCEVVAAAALSLWLEDLERRDTQEKSVDLPRSVEVDAVAIALFRSYLEAHVEQATVRRK
jgi:hypothetical protein